MLIAATKVYATDPCVGGGRIFHLKPAALLPTNLPKRLSSRRPDRIFLANQRIYSVNDLT
jgi:hypothetical protein